MNKDHLKQLIRMFKLDHVSVVAAKTSLGDLALTMRKDDDNWYFTLDSVPVEPDTNKDLFKVFNIEP